MSVGEAVETKELFYTVRNQGESLLGLWSRVVVRRREYLNDLFRRASPRFSLSLKCNLSHGTVPLFVTPYQNPSLRCITYTYTHDEHHLTAPTFRLLFLSPWEMGVMHV